MSCSGHDTMDRSIQFHPDPINRTRAAEPPVNKVEAAEHSLCPLCSNEGI
jgi:hypothetical protein